MVRLDRSVALVSALLFIVGCGGESSTPADSPDAGTPDSVASRTVPILGGGSHDVATLELKVIADGPTQQLNRPTDLAFNPLRPNELWVTSQADNAIVVIFDAGAANQRHAKSNGAGSGHFLVRPSALAFADGGNFATVHDTDQITQPSTPATFMGPTLWSSDPTIFDGGHGGHMDMLHNTPLGMGIAWEAENTFWVFDGYHSSITRYAFNEDHGPGGADHSDGEVARYAEGEVARVEGVPSHLEFEHRTSKLWVVDTGNRRILTLDPRQGTRGRALLPNYDGSQQYRMDGTAVVTVVPASAGLDKPSGIALRDDLVFVSDNGTGRIWAFEAKSGEAVDWLDTGLGAGALAGIAFDTSGQLYFVDMAESRVLRLATR